MTKQQRSTLFWCCLLDTDKRNTKFHPILFVLIFQHQHKNMCCANLFLFFTTTFKNNKTKNPNHCSSNIHNSLTFSPTPLLQISTTNQTIYNNKQPHSIIINKKTIIIIPTICKKQHTQQYYYNLPHM